MAKNRGAFWMLCPCAALLILAAWLRGAEYDEQYTLFLTAGVPRPDWPEGIFAAGLARALQAGHAGWAQIALDLRRTDVHPPLYFWTVSAWRALAGPDLFAARLFSAICGAAALALTGAIARAGGIPAARAIAMTAGCYGFAYTASIARGFALAELAILAGVFLLLRAQRSGMAFISGLCLGAASLTNYLSVFAAGAVLAAALTGRRFRPRFVPVLAGFLLFIPADLWWFLAQRGSREGQFPPFHLLPALARLAVRGAGAIFGALPLYLDGAGAKVLAGVLGLVLAGAGLLAVRNARRIADPDLRRLLFLGATGTPFGLLLLGLLFGNTPIEVRYLTFATPFVGLLLAATLPARAAWGVMTIQAAALTGLLTAPSTMQPARAAARDAAALAGGAVVLLPSGNDGTGIPGAFAIEAPPALMLRLVAGSSTPDGLTRALVGDPRVAAAFIEQDDASRAAVVTMRAVLAGPAWREVARRGRVALYERIGPE